VCQAQAEVDYNLVYPGATGDQWLEIKVKGAERANGKNRRTPHSDEDEWFTIWDILFPETPRPLNPHALHPGEVQFLLDATRIYQEQDYPAVIARHLLGETANPDTHAFVQQIFSVFNYGFIGFVERLATAPRTPIPMQLPPIPMLPLPPMLPLQPIPMPSFPSLAAPSPDQYAGSNTGNPHVVPPQRLPLRGLLQASPHASIGVNAGAEDVDDEDGFYWLPPGVP
jgi:hypothetical protein